MATNPSATTSRWTVFFACLTAAFAGCASPGAAPGANPGGRAADERAPSFKATELLSPAEIRGPHHTVADEVPTEGVYHVFTIRSDFGAFEAEGRSLLKVRLREVEALAALRDVSKSKVFLAAAGNSVVNVGKGAAGVVTDPAGTAKGLGAGIKRFGVNLGRSSKRVVESATSDDPAKDSKPDEGNAAASAANSLLGVTKASRQWARKVGVDPYSTNPVLRKALEDIAKVDAAGSIVTKVVVPIPMVVTATASVGDLVWSKDPQELLKINEQWLRSLGVSEAIAKRLRSNSAFTLSYATRMLGALAAVKIPGLADFVAAAAGSKSEREALFYVESAEQLQQWHAKAPFKAALTDSLVLATVGADDRAVVFLPVDWIPWTGAADTTLTDLDTRLRAELHAATVLVALTGKASDAAAKAIAAKGWKIGKS